MKIAVVGRGNVGGGLADRWERAGHSVARIGRDGGDVSDADAVLIAVPGAEIADALDKVQGLEGKMVIDATNLFGAPRQPGFEAAGFDQVSVEFTHAVADGMHGAIVKAVKRS